MKPIDIIHEIYDWKSPSYKILMVHSAAVAQKALAIARRVSHMNPDYGFIEEAAMLHDIGIFLTDAPSIGCTGEYPYVCHGYLGRNLLEKRGSTKHALVCERHVGVGLTADEIRSRNLPIPVRDMVPVSLEEQIICYADKFFSKKNSSNGKQLRMDEVIGSIEKYGQDKVVKFMDWVKMFE
jgi:uncharacterized protein